MWANTNILVGKVKVLQFHDNIKHESIKRIKRTPIKSLVTFY